jgi:DNA-binding XRE family transcriptional regulator
MALAGTLKDFSLADIFQLISLQKKTGYLTLRSDQDVVTVTFLEGTVVGAESLNKRIEDRLGHVLVKTARISKEELAKALEVQKQTLQRLGYILVAENFIDPESLRTALAIQMQQTIFRLFRWKDGDYNFEARDSVEYDREYVTPMSAESILMEGIRMLDEWPLIEKKIPAFDKIFEKVPLPAPPILDTRVDMPPGGLAGLFEEQPPGSDAREQPGAVPGAAHQLRLSQEEMAVYQHVNGVFTVQEIIDRSGLNEFETCKSLFELLNRQIIRPILPVREEASAEPRRFFLAPAALENLAMPILWAWIGLSVLLLPFHPLDHLPWGDRSAQRDRMVLDTRLKLQRVCQSIREYELRTGHLPANLSVLVQEGNLPPRDLVDAYRFPLIYQSTGNGYTLAARGPSGELLQDLMFSSAETAE